MEKEMLIPQKYTKKRRIGARYKYEPGAGNDSIKIRLIHPSLIFDRIGPRSVDTLGGRLKFNFGKNGARNKKRRTDEGKHNPPSS